MIVHGLLHVEIPEDVVTVICQTQFIVLSFIDILPVQKRTNFFKPFAKRL